MQDLKLLQGLLPEMAGIINAEPGRPYTAKDAETLLILQRRLPEGDLKEALSRYNAIFGVHDGAKVSDITDSVSAYVKIRVLLAGDQTDFDPRSLRDLIKECHVYIDKMTNIVRLSKTQGLTAEDFQRERIEKTIAKNEAIIRALEGIISDTEKKIERQPNLEEIEPEQPADSNENQSVEEAEVQKKSRPVIGKSIVDSVTRALSFRKEKEQVEEHLRDEERKSSSTMCQEIPFYENRLIATEIIPCKDFECFALLKRKNNVYFGRTWNLKKNVYDNRDQSLMELTDFTEEFLQFMSVDLLSDDYELHRFSEKEKLSMRMYFNFVSRCFEEYIGKLLTVAEYLDFKSYYNRLVRKEMDLDEKARQDYYRALPLAEEYLDLMASYNMVTSRSVEEVVERIMAEMASDELDDLKLIERHHIVDQAAGDEIRSLAEEIRDFRRRPVADEKSGSIEQKVVSQALPMKSTGQYMNMPGILQNPGSMQTGFFFMVRCFDESGRVIDQAVYAAENLPQAVHDFEDRSSKKKSFGIMENGVFIPLSESGGNQG